MTDEYEVHNMSRHGLDKQSVYRLGFSDIIGYCGAWFLRRQKTDIGFLPPISTTPMLVSKERALISPRFWRNKVYVVDSAEGWDMLLTLHSNGVLFHKTGDPNNVTVYDFGTRKFIVPKPVAMSKDEQEKAIKELVHLFTNPHWHGFTAINNYHINSLVADRPDRFPTMQGGFYHCMCALWGRENSSSSDTWIGNMLGGILRDHYAELVTAPLGEWVWLEQHKKYACIPFMMYNGSKDKPSINIVFADTPIEYTVKEY